MLLELFQNRCFRMCFIGWSEHRTIVMGKVIHTDQKGIHDPKIDGGLSHRQCNRHFNILRGKIFIQFRKDLEWEEQQIIDFAIN